MTTASRSESRRSLSEPGCTTVKEVLARVGDKWSVFVITLLGERTMRFTELQRSIDGISQRMLTLTLRQLERDGLVDRVVYPIVPPRVEYSLTALGKTLLAPLLGLAGWADAHRGDIEAARVEYDAQAEASPTPWLVPAAGEPQFGQTTSPSAGGADRRRTAI
ncbi:MAG: helix-turn-helix transcriptional regulator [Chloroflexota bacterium]|nr:helix-turn-helix transcriptional regulator [Chloroflexota bacterium]